MEATFEVLQRRVDWFNANADKLEKNAFFASAAAVFCGRDGRRVSNVRPVLSEGKPLDVMVLGAEVQRGKERKFLAVWRQGEGGRIMTQVPASLQPHLKLADADHTQRETIFRAELVMEGVYKPEHSDQADGEEPEQEVVQDPASEPVERVLAEGQPVVPETPSGELIRVPRLKDFVYKVCGGNERLVGELILTNDIVASRSPHTPRARMIFTAADMYSLLVKDTLPDDVLRLFNRQMHHAGVYKKHGFSGLGHACANVDKMRYTS